MKTLLFIYFLFCFTFIYQILPAQTNITKGQIVENEICTQNPLLSYAYYAPSNYSTSKKYPVIFGFDAGARGKLPVGLYEKIAEKYEFIIACSNSTYNENTQNYNIASVMFDDVKSKFSIDTAHIYLTGLSGGSRLASAIAYNSSNVAGVIGCAAGLANYSLKFDKINFSYVGIVGIHDMNYYEIVALDEKLDTNNIQHQIIYFDGLHDWSPDYAFEEAIQWMNIFAMKKHRCQIDTIQINNLSNKFLKIVSDSTNQNLYEKYAAYQALANCWNGIKDISLYKKRVAEIEQNQLFQKQQTEKDEILQKEVQLRTKLISEFQNFIYSPEKSKTINWWKVQIQDLQKVAKDSNVEQWNSGVRILETLYIFSRSEYVNFYETTNFDATYNTLIIWSLVKPTDYTPYYLLAKLYAKSNRNHKSLHYLELAISNGFNNIEKINNEPIFSPLKNNKHFQQLLAKITK